MRFFSSILAASLVVVAAGMAVNRGVEVEAPIDIKEACRGLMIWHPDGFYRSETTVRYHDYMWQCTRWNQGKETPEESDVWRDLGPCDPDVMNDQMVFGKRSAPLEARDEPATSPKTAVGISNGMLSLSFVLAPPGTTMIDGALWQTDIWNSGEEPGVSSHWTVVHKCDGSLWKAKRSCDGIPTFTKGALHRSGSTIQHDNKAYQAKHWSQTSTPDDTEAWTLLGDC
ncbi:unnamed protein product [Rhizoctonia solani]|uniref:Chitin-binding type-3 domain-containing protein n=1 Tax=Rhizoctonia solani TaxID=456999 RepID=A0A8H2ZYA4_9AGAM|nr:unnamed protein product [Rhizoctonia solani]